jgi:hypothetical protein
MALPIVFQQIVDNRIKSYLARKGKETLIVTQKKNQQPIKRDQKPLANQPRWPLPPTKPPTIQGANHYAPLRGLEDKDTPEPDKGDAKGERAEGLMTRDEETSNLAKKLPVEAKKHLEPERGEPQNPSWTPEYIAKVYHEIWGKPSQTAKRPAPTSNYAKKEETQEIPPQLPEWRKTQKVRPCQDELKTNPLKRIVNILQQMAQKEKAARKTSPTMSRPRATPPVLSRTPKGTKETTNPRNTDTYREMLELDQILRKSILQES